MAAKPTLRAHWRRRRAEALPSVADALLAAAQREVIPLLPAGRRLGLWWPLPGEPDLRPLADRLPDRLALPAIVPWQGEAAGAAHGRRLVYRPWTRDAVLLPDACGIPSPAPGDGAADAALPPAALGLLLVPALALDPRTGLRLGSGGGWYDRLRADPHWRRIPALAVLPEACLSGGLPCDPWDVPFDGWLDEHGVHRRECNVT